MKTNGVFQIIFFILLFLVNINKVYCQNSNTGTSETNMSSTTETMMSNVITCVNINPLTNKDCIEKSSTDKTCCFLQPKDSTVKNKCIETSSSTANIEHNTLVTIDQKEYTKFCILPSTKIIPSTCGKENPEKYEDCIISGFPKGTLPEYWCCFSKISVSGKFKSQCIPTEIKAKVVLDYNSGGLDYKCMTSEGTASSKFLYMPLFLIYLINFMF